jgi:hypothetical protein
VLVPDLILQVTQVASDSISYVMDYLMLAALVTIAFMEGKIHQKVKTTCRRLSRIEQHLFGSSEDDFNGG